jgi:hypothetical protein
MLGMQQAQSHAHQLGHHVPSSYPSLDTSSATSLSCVPVSPTSMLKPGRPKLSVNTALSSTQTRTFGKGSSLRLDTLSAISPTIRNTFSNAYEGQSAAKPTQDTVTQDLDTPKDESATESLHIELSSASSLSSTSTVSLESSVCPYIQPSHLKSILVNGHYPKIIVRNMSVQRPRFPLQKSVSFREPLDEEIKTTKYILAHSDIDNITLDSSSESLAQSIDSSSTTAEIENVSTPEPNMTLPTIDIHPPYQSEIELQVPTAPASLSIPQFSSPHPSPYPSPRLLPRQSHSLPPRLSVCPRKVGHKRDSSSSGSDSDDSCAHTPVAGRSKRRRWAWTLGPLPGYTAPEGGEIEIPIGSREGSVAGDDLSISPASDPSP